MRKNSIYPPLSFEDFTGYAKIPATSWAGKLVEDFLASKKKVVGMQFDDAAELQNRRTMINKAIRELDLSKQIGTARREDMLFLKKL